jgi:hypothetical protein
MIATLQASPETDVGNVRLRSGLDSEHEHKKFVTILATIMREVNLVCLCCAVVPIFALLKGDPQVTWREFLRKDSREDLSSQQVK